MENIIEKLNFNQWKNTETVIHWFRVLSIHYGKKFRRSHSICQAPKRPRTKKIRIIKHCRKSFLYHKDEVWKKKESESRSDVTIGSKDGAEICELTGVYIL